MVIISLQNKLKGIFMQRKLLFLLLCLGVLVTLFSRNAYGPPSNEEKFSLGKLRSIEKNKNADIRSLGKSDVTNKQEISNLYGNLPLTFVENKGQMEDRVRFCARSPKATVYFTPAEVVFHFVEKEKTNEETAHHFEQKTPSFISAIKKLSGLTKTHKELVLRVSFPDANPNVVIEGEEQLSGKVNVFRGNDSSKWLTNIPTFKKITYRNLWDGIDLVYYGEPGYGLKYDLIVHPEADFSKAKLKYEGNQQLSLNSDNDLIIDTAFGSIIEKKPYSYQEINGRKEQVQSLFYINDGTLGWHILSYDKNRILVIDPGLIYSTYLGGSGNDGAQSIAIDSEHCAYVTGITLSTDFPTTPGAFDRNYHYDSDCFVAKLNASGTELIYSTYLGGGTGGYNVYDRAWDIAVDVYGHAYITGETYCIDFPTTPGAFDTTYNGGNDVFVTKLSIDGSSLIYSTFLGKDAYDSAYSICLDLDGCAYVVGCTSSDRFPTTPGAFDTAYLPGTHDDAFVSKISADGSHLIYSTFVRGSSHDNAQGVAIDGYTNVYIVGFTKSVDFPISQDAFDKTCDSANYDGFITKLDPSGSMLVYSSYIGGSSTDECLAIALDYEGYAYIAGTTRSVDFPTVLGSYDTIKNENDNTFVSKINIDGSALIYSTFFGNAYEKIRDIAVDESFRAYICGTTSYANFPVTRNASDKILDEIDAFVTILNENGSDLVYSSYFGGSGAEWGESIVVDEFGHIYLAGSTTSRDFSTTEGAFDRSFNGGMDDCFVSKLIIPKLLISSSCDGGIVIVPGEGDYVYDPSTIADITAKADHGYHFVNWSGTAVDAGKVADPNSQTTTIFMDFDYTIIAHFERNEIIYVDDDAVSDPGHGNPLISDPVEDGSPQHPLDAIQDALNAADAGIPIIVLDGIYKSTGNRDLDFKGKNLTLKSLNGASSTIIDCEGNAEQPHRALCFKNGENETSIIEGFTIKNGYAQLGGGIYCSNSSPTIKNCIIRDNHSFGDGGAIVCSNAKISDCEIVSNSAGNRGGGLFCDNGATPLVIGTTISQNISVNLGGGIYFLSSEININDCIIESNYSGSWSGGVDLSECSGILKDCIIRLNHSEIAGGINAGKTVEISNTVIEQNTAEYIGGGVLCTGGYGVRNIRNCTIVGNSAGLSGGGIQLWDNSRTFLIDSIVWNNIALDGHEIALSISYDAPSLDIYFSDVEGGSAEIYLDNGCNLFWDVSNLNTDPTFLDKHNSNFHLSPLSPCVDAGDPTSDYSLEPLPNGCRIDMGAYCNTPEATKSPGDVDNDLDIDVDDLLLIYGALGSTGFDPKLDIDADGMVTFADLRIAHNHMCSSLQYMGGVSTLWSFDYMTPTNPSVHGLNPYIDQSQLDNDYDGKTNYEEYIAGTNPTDASSLFEITDIDFSIAINSNAITISWTAVEGKDYCLYYASSPDDTIEWLPVEGDYAMSNGVATQTINIGEGMPIRFFKVKVR
jgi:hypothetical protein